MKTGKLLIIFFLTIAILGQNTWAMEKSPHKVEALNDIRRLDKRQMSKLASRYVEYRSNHNLFTNEQFDIIEKNDLAPIIHELLLHKRIKIYKTDQLIDFAREVRDAKIDFALLEKRITRYVTNHELVFTALRKAIEREKFHNWKINRNKEVKERNGSFVNNINTLDLSEDDRDKVINTYAVCVDSFNLKEDREKMKPSICNPNDNYTAPHSFKKIVTVKTTPAVLETARTNAYRILIDAAKEIAAKEQLDIFEKVMMAKCISEQSLRFFTPLHHPFRALKKMHDLDKKSPEEAFFTRTGVCGNFSGIAYNVAVDLGLKDEVFMTRDGLHVYLEFKHGKSYYHTHPFNSTSNCDIVKFKEDYEK